MTKHADPFSAFPIVSDSGKEEKPSSFSAFPEDFSAFPIVDPDRIAAQEAQKRVRKVPIDFRTRGVERFAEITGASEPSPRYVKDAWQEYTDRPIQSVPFLGSISEGISLKRVWDAARRFEEDKDFTERDFEVMEAFLVRAYSDSSVGAIVIDIITELPAFVGEFVATGGLFTIGRKGAVKGIGALVRRVIEKNVAARIGVTATRRAVGRTGRIIGRAAVGVPAGAALQSSVFVHRAITSAIRMSLPEIGIDEAGDVAFLFDQEDPDFWDAVKDNLGKGYLDTYIELFSERTGGSLALIPGKSKLAFLKGGFLKRWLKIGPDNTVAKFSQKIAARAGWHGVIGEIFEEEVGKALRAGTSLEEYRLTTGKELTAEAIAFSIPGAASLTAQSAAGFLQRRGEATAEQTRELTEEERIVDREVRVAARPPVREFTAEELDTDEGLEDFVATFPDAARTIAGKSTASVEDLSVALASGERLTTKQRTELSQRVRNTLRPDLVDSERIAAPETFAVPREFTAGEVSDPGGARTLILERPEEAREIATSNDPAAWEAILLPGQRISSRQKERVRQKIIREFNRDPLEDVEPVELSPELENVPQGELKAEGPPLREPASNNDPTSFDNLTDEELRLVTESSGLKFDNKEPINPEDSREDRDARVLTEESNRGKIQPTGNEATVEGNKLRVARLEAMSFDDLRQEMRNAGLFVPANYVEGNKGDLINTLLWNDGVLRAARVRGRLSQEAADITKTLNENQHNPEVIAAFDESTPVGVTLEVNIEGEFPREVDQDLLAIARVDGVFAGISPFHRDIDRRWTEMVEAEAIRREDHELLRIVFRDAGPDILKNINLETIRPETVPGLTARYLPVFRGGVQIGSEIQLATGRGAERAQGAPTWTFIHEFGHTGYFEYLGQEARDYVVRLYTSMKGMPSQDPRYANAMEESLGIAYGHSISSETDSFVYHSSLVREWFAEQFASYAINKTTPPGILQGLFNKIVAKIGRTVFNYEAPPQVTPELTALFDTILEGQNLSRNLLTREQFDRESAQPAAFRVDEQRRLQAAELDLSTQIAIKRRLKEVAEERPLTKAGQLAPDTAAALQTGRLPINLVASREEQIQDIATQEDHPQANSADIAQRVTAVRKGFKNLPYRYITDPILMPFRIMDSLVRWEARQLIDVLAEKGGKTGTIVANRFRSALDRNKVFLGRLQKFQTETQRFFSRPSNFTTTWGLQLTKRPSGSNWAVADVVTAVEGTGRAVSKKTQAIVERLREAAIVTAAILEEVGLVQKTEKGKRVFRGVRAGKIFLRLATTELHDILVNGPGDTNLEYQVMVHAFAEANNKDVAEVQKIFEAVRQNLTGQLRGSIRQIGPEIQRQLDVVPTHIWVGGKPINLFEVDPRRYLDRVIRDSAARAAVVAEFGQDGKSAEQLREAYVNAGGRGETFDWVMRATSNLPPVALRTTSVQGSIYRFMRIVDATFAAMRSLLLTGAVIPNIPEPLGTIGPVLGYRRMIRAMGKMVSPKERKQVIEELIRTRAYTKDVIDFSLRRNHAIESVLRRTADLINRASGIKIINEAQEQVYGFASIMWLGEMNTHFKETKEPSQADIWRLRLFQYSREDAERLASARGTPEEYEEALRRSVRFFISSATLRAETSFLRNTRAYNFAFWFTTFFSDTIRIFDRHGKVLAESIRAGDTKQIQAASLGLGRLLAGKTLAGASAAFIYSLAIGGIFGLLVKKEEAEDDLIDYVFESFGYSVFGGIYGAFLRTGLQARQGQKGEDVVSGLLRVVGPYAMTVDFYNFVGRKGPYKDLDWGEAAVRFGELHVTAVRTLPGRAAMSVLGKAYGDPKMDFAVKRYWAWRFDPDNESIPTRATLGSITEDQAEFRKFIRRATEDQLEGRDPTANLSKALRVRGKDQVAVNASLRARKILDDLDGKKLRAVREHIGEDAFRILRLHDLLLDQMMTPMDYSGRRRRGRRSRR